MAHPWHVCHSTRDTILMKAIWHHDASLDLHRYGRQWRVPLGGILWGILYEPGNATPSKCFCTISPADLIEA
eukprot:4979221-Amphidinium_carterae.1